MSSSAATPPQVAAPASAGSTDGTLAKVREAVGLRTLPLGLLACLALAALTLLAPSAPTYDPWAWIVWGREILHLDLQTTAGPSWKPLPVAFTTVFALFGSAAPTLWVLVARTGAFYGALAAFRLGRRLGGKTHAGLAAGGAAAVGVLLAPWYVRNGALANSEGLQVAFALAAIERHLAGKPRVAFALALGLGMLRPEAWAFVGLYGLWLLWSDRRSLWLVAVGLVSLPVLWLAPEKWGSDDWLRAAHRAQQPVGNSAAFSSNPTVEVLREGAAMLTPPIWAGLGMLAVVAALRRDRRVAVLVAATAGWVLLVAVMTANGYSGNQRYLIVPAALVIVLAAAGAGQAVALLRPRTVLAAGALTVALVAAFAIPSLHRLDRVIDSTTYQARLIDELGPLVDQAGGAATLRACGHAYSGAYLVPAVAWQLHVHTVEVGFHPVGPPAVVFRS
ncbi:MAG TPA: hypothetical protein VFB41_04350, partial [Solirubrobacteraceae bacterium]|nr:hypothetical protein [Solirubrobacteraceae bacterium]